MRFSLSGLIQNEVLTITSEHPYSEDHFERKLQAKISPSGKKIEKQEKGLINSKGKHQMEPNKFSSEHIQDEFLNITSETSSS